MAHNAVGFFLTAGFLGIMYYFMPETGRAADLFLPPVGHPLLVADLPLHLGRARITCTTPHCRTGRRRLGMVFSIMLWMPSWGGMINGLMTLSGAWDKLRTDPVH